MPIHVDVGSFHACPVYKIDALLFHRYVTKLKVSLKTDTLVTSHCVLNLPPKINKCLRYSDMAPRTPLKTQIFEE